MLSAILMVKDCVRNLHRLKISDRLGGGPTCFVFELSLLRCVLNAYHFHFVIVYCRHYWSSPRVI